MKSIYDGLDNFKDPSKRDYCSSVVFGDLGKGKSTFLSQMAKMYIGKTQGKEVPRKVLICDPSSARGFDQFPQVTLEQIKYGVMSGGKRTQPWKSGIMVLRDVRWTNPEWFEVLNSYFKNGFVILDESRNYIPQGGELHEEQTEFFTKHRNNSVDVMLVSHNYMSLNLNLRKQFRYYYCFKTGDVPTDERWFETRSLPVQLWGITQLLKAFVCDAAKMQPMAVYDAHTGRKQWFIHPDSEKDLKVWVADGKGGKVLVPYHKIKK